MLVNFSFNIIFLPFFFYLYFVVSVVNKIIIKIFSEEIKEILNFWKLHVIKQTRDPFFYPTNILLIILVRWSRTKRIKSFGNNHMGTIRMIFKLTLEVTFTQIARHCTQLVTIGTGDNDRCLACKADWWRAPASSASYIRTPRLPDAAKMPQCRPIVMDVPRTDLTSDSTSITVTKYQSFHPINTKLLRCYLTIAG